MSVIADTLLSTKPGGRIPTVSEFCAAANAGSGTIQSAISSLQQAGAVTLTTHGHQGTRLVHRSLASLWVASGRGTLRAMLPLPSSLEFAGLATALREAFSVARIPLSLGFRQGSKHRFNALRRGLAEFLVCSFSTARALAPAKSHVISLTPHSFFARDSVAVITRAGEVADPCGRVLIDRDSRDHMLLTAAEFPHAQLIQAPYLILPELVVRGDADAAVWHRTSASPVLTASGIALHPLSQTPNQESDDISRAAIVSRADDPITTAVLNAVINVEKLAKIQSEVLRFHRTPTF